MTESGTGQTTGPDGPTVGPPAPGPASDGQVPADVLDAREQLREQLGRPELGDDLLQLALTHRSYAYEHGGLPTNERLEFLGDSVLGVVVTETLYVTKPDLPEGLLAKLRAAVVNARALADVAHTIGLGEHILLGKGEESTGGRLKASILSDTVEAVIGAIYLSGGFDNAAAVVHRLFDPLLAAAAGLGAGLDWKTSLQELVSSHSLGVPEYVIEAEGPDHEKTFTAQVRVASRLHGHGVGRSKKEAEQQAAEAAYRTLAEEHGDPAATDPGPVAGPSTLAPVALRPDEPDAAESQPPSPADAGPPIS